MLSTARAEVIDKVVAVVNDQPITLYELDKLMAEKIDEIKKAEGGKEQKEKFKNYRDQALQSLIEDKLLAQAMKERQITVTDADVQHAIDNILKRNNLTKQQLADQLSKKGITMNAYLDDLKNQLAKVKFMSQVIAPRVKVTDQDLDDFFAKNPDKFSNYQSAQMAQIILPLSETASDQEIAAARKVAEEIIAKAKKGANFEDLGKQYSQNPQTAVAATYQVSQLAPQLVEAISDLKAGEVSEPVRSALGMHIIKLYERKTLAGEEFKAVREQLREKVFEEKLEEELQKYVDELKSKSYVEIKSVS
jgi:peptidyl-prolyl cis-trans isomerase SurA